MVTPDSLGGRVSEVCMCAKGQYLGIAPQLLSTLFSETGCLSFSWNSLIHPGSWASKLGEPTHLASYLLAL